MNPKEIQLAETRNTSVRQSLHRNEESQQQSPPQSKRRPQNMVLYVLVVLSELITIFLSALLTFIPAESKMYTYIVFMVMTVVRSTIFILSSIQLNGCNKKTILLYTLLDNTFLMQLASVVTYTFLNYSNVQIQPLAIGALIAYPILLFCLVGNFRLMLAYCKWNKAQVIVYKLVKIIGSTYFLIYGTILIIKSQDNTQSDLFMLWVFTTCGFWGQMFFCINSFDESDGLSTKYVLVDD